MSDYTTKDIDAGLFREVMGNYPTGVAVVTGRAEDGELLAMVVGTFSSVSLDPPLVSFMPMKSSKSFSRLRECESLCINILGGEQEELVSTIARRWEDKFAGVDWFPSPSGDPVLAESVAWVDARLVQTVDAGDHWIALCSVVDLAVPNPVAPLIFFQGGYGSFVGTSLMARMDHEMLPAIEEAERARPAVEALAESIGCEARITVAISKDEMATVLSAVAPGVNREAGLARRVPIVPPIGDTFVFDLPEADQEKWISKARGVEEDAKQVYRNRLAFVREKGYLLSFLPAEGSAAYEEMHAASRAYEKGRLTPAEERKIRQAIVESTVDYSLRDLEADAVYDVGSLVLPARDRDGAYTLTLRLAQLPPQVTGSQIHNWIEQAKSVVAHMEEAVLETSGGGRRDGAAVVDA
ncbi:flavin reductase [Kocuria tytonicola]|uniref:Flavin reductase n=1 Tax=Kocuria tytonicola TaxID=2055946 RepID=A0A3L9L9P1_9MICC|nr:flavin reductase family protein [Kocuria tytonicola]RLY95098.1 flavin reductase [Kocuria tytonicola]